ncbi:uncharacterized protein C2orf81 homolog [Hirundo rustica]|uniref:uncharacterized protein C2orf81 homolog n=1 Tax=Hirundo rustica TaxID=43150 RepID=UPI001A94737D|nr:uncharacterized protein C2orf81 homolog [Hirundo rustica]
MAEKGKSRGAGAKSKADKSRTSARGQARQAKKGSPKTPGRTPRQPSPGPDGEAPPREPLDVRPILDELLERVLSECALAAAARQRVPFTVSRARDAILFVAEWKFLARDEGDPAFEGDPEPERDGVWSEDEEPQTCPLDSWTRGVVFVDDESSLSSDEGSFEDLPATAEAESPLVCPDTVPDTVPVLVVPVSPEQVPAAAAAQDLGADIAAPVPGPPSPEPPVASRSPERVRRLSRDPARGGILSKPPGRSRRPSRPPRPGPAPLDAPRPRAPPPAAPSEPPAQAAQASAEGTASVGHQAPPPPPSARPSLAPMQPRRASRGTGVPRPGPRRGAALRVLPEVKVVDVTDHPGTREGPQGPAGAV